jgi:hypothetical protein
VKFDDLALNAKLSVDEFVERPLPEGAPMELAVTNVANSMQKYGIEWAGELATPDVAHLVGQKAQQYMAQPAVQALSGAEAKKYLGFAIATEGFAHAPLTHEGRGEVMRTTVSTLINGQLNKMQEELKSTAARKQYLENIVSAGEDSTGKQSTDNYQPGTPWLVPGKRDKREVQLARDELQRLQDPVDIQKSIQQTAYAAAKLQRANDADLANWYLLNSTPDSARARQKRERFRKEAEQAVKDNAHLFHTGVPVAELMSMEDILNEDRIDHPGLNAVREIDDLMGKVFPTDTRREMVQMVRGRVDQVRKDWSLRSFGVDPKTLENAVLLEDNKAVDGYVRLFSGVTPSLRDALANAAEGRRLQKAPGEQADKTQRKHSAEVASQAALAALAGPLTVGNAAIPYSVNDLKKDTSDVAGWIYKNVKTPAFAKLREVIGDILSDERQGTPLGEAVGEYLGAMAVDNVTSVRKVKNLYTGLGLLWNNAHSLDFDLRNNILTTLLDGGRTFDGAPRKEDYRYRGALMSEHTEGAETRLPPVEQLAKDQAKFGIYENFMRVREEWKEKHNVDAAKGRLARLYLAGHSTSDWGQWWGDVTLVAGNFLLENTIDEVALAIKKPQLAVAALIANETIPLGIEQAKARGWISLHKPFKRHILANKVATLVEEIAPDRPDLVRTLNQKLRNTKITPDIDRELEHIAALGDSYISTRDGGMAKSFAQRLGKVAPDFLAHLGEQGENLLALLEKDRGLMGWKSAASLLTGKHASASKGLKQAFAQSLDPTFFRRVAEKMGLERTVLEAYGDKTRQLMTDLGQAKTVDEREVLLTKLRERVHLEAPSTDAADSLRLWDRADVLSRQINDLSGSAREGAVDEMQKIAQHFMANRMPDNLTMEALQKMAALETPALHRTIGRLGGFLHRLTGRSMFPDIAEFQKATSAAMDSYRFFADGGAEMVTMARLDGAVKGLRRSHAYTYAHSKVQDQYDRVLKSLELESEALDAFERTLADTPSEGVQSAVLAGRDIVAGMKAEKVELETNIRALENEWRESAGHPYEKPWDFQDSLLQKYIDPDQMADLMDAEPAVWGGMGTGTVREQVDVDGMETDIAYELDVAEKSFAKALGDHRYWDSWGKKLEQFKQEDLGKEVQAQIEQVPEHLRKYLTELPEVYKRFETDGPGGSTARAQMRQLLDSAIEALNMRRSEPKEPWDPSKYRILQSEFLPGNPKQEGILTPISSREMYDYHDSVDELIDDLQLNDAGKDGVRKVLADHPDEQVVNMALESEGSIINVVIARPGTPEQVGRAQKEHIKKAIDNQWQVHEQADFEVAKNTAEAMKEFIDFLPDRYFANLASGPWHAASHLAWGQAHLEIPTFGLEHGIYSAGAPSVLAHELVGHVWMGTVFDENTLGKLHQRFLKVSKQQLQASRLDPRVQESLDAITRYEAWLPDIMKHPTKAGNMKRLRDMFLERSIGGTGDKGYYGMFTEWFARQVEHYYYKRRGEELHPKARRLAIDADPETLDMIDVVMKNPEKTLLENMNITLGDMRARMFGMTKPVVDPDAWGKQALSPHVRLAFELGSVMDQEPLIKALNAQKVLLDHGGFVTKDRLPEAKARVAKAERELRDTQEAVTQNFEWGPVTHQDEVLKRINQPHMTEQLAEYHRLGQEALQVSEAAEFLDKWGYNPLMVHSLPYWEQIKMTRQLGRVMAHKVASYGARMEDLMRVFGRLSPMERKILERSVRHGKLSPHAQKMIEADPELRRALPNLTERRDYTKARAANLETWMQTESELQAELLESAKKAGFLDVPTYNNMRRAGYVPNLYGTYERPNLVVTDAMKKARQGAPKPTTKGQIGVEGSEMEFARDLVKYRVFGRESDGFIHDKRFTKKKHALAYLKRVAGADAEIAKTADGWEVRTAVGDVVRVARPMGERANTLDLLTGTVERLEEGGRTRLVATRRNTLPARIEQFARLNRDMHIHSFLESLRPMGLVMNQADYDRIFSKAARRTGPQGADMFAKDFLKLPESKQFGNLAGGWVHRQVFTEMNNMRHTFDQVRSWMDGVTELMVRDGTPPPWAEAKNLLKGISGFDRAVGDTVKYTQILMGPATWFANVVSNLMFSTLAAGPFLLNPTNWRLLSRTAGEVFGDGQGLVRQAWSKKAGLQRELRNMDLARDPLTDEAIRSGVISGALIERATNPHMRRAAVEIADMHNQNKLRQRLVELDDLLQEESAAKLTPKDVRALQLEVVAAKQALAGLERNYAKGILFSLYEAFRRVGAVFGDSYKDVTGLSRNKAVDMVKDMYGRIDDFFKLATYKYLRRTMGEAQAAWNVRTFMQNYAELPSWVQKSQRSTMGALVPAFQYEMTRILGNGLQHRGMRVASMLGAVAGLNKLNATLSGVNADRIAASEDVMGRRTPLERTLANMTRLRFYNPVDKSLMFDADLGNTFLPLFQMVSSENTLARAADHIFPEEDRNGLQSALVAGIRYTGNFVASRPVISWTAGLLMGRDHFTGRPLLPKRASERRGKDYFDAFHHLILRSMIPPLLPGGRSWTDLGRAYDRPLHPDTGRTLGGPSLGQVVMRSLFNMNVKGLPAYAVSRALGGRDKSRAVDDRDIIKSTLWYLREQKSTSFNTDWPMFSSSIEEREAYARLMAEEQGTPEYDKRRAELGELLKKERQYDLFLERHTSGASEYAIAKKLQALEERGMAETFGSDLSALEQALALRAWSKAQVATGTLQEYADMARMTKSGRWRLKQNPDDLKQAREVLLATIRDRDVPSQAQVILQDLREHWLFAEQKAYERAWKQGLVEDE